MAVKLAAVLLASLASLGALSETEQAGLPEVCNVAALQSFPWNGKVDITYDVAGDMAAGVPEWNLPALVVSATNCVSGASYVADAAALSGETGLEEGAHHVVWDLNAQGLEFKSDEVVVTVAYVKPFDVPGNYCVIDLSAGTGASSYPASHIADVPSGGWTEMFKTTNLVLRLVGPGSFKMGGLYDVALSKPYYCGVFEVTQKQYELVMGLNPSSKSNKGDMRPVENVSWNKIHGTSSTYDWPNSADVDPNSFVGRLRTRTGFLIDLPTEAQWEYACRAGTTSAYNNGGDTETYLELAGRYAGNQSDGEGGYSSNHTTVGSYEPNLWGIYDMHGNVYEWCLDWQGDLSDGVTDPLGPLSGSSRIVRGGSYSSDAEGCTSSYRIGVVPSPSGASANIGFRLARMLPDADKAVVVCLGDCVFMAETVPFADGDVTVSGYSGQYDGAAHGVSVMVADGVEGVMVKYAMSADGEFAADPPALTNAGSMTVWCEVSAPGYVTQTNSATITIVSADNSWIVEPTMSGWVVGQEPVVPTMGEAKFGEVGVSYGESGTACPTEPGEYAATFAVSETENYAGLTKVVPFKIWTTEEIKLREAFDRLPARVEADGNGGYKVALTNDVDVLDEPVEIPDDIGPVTIDLNEHDLIGADGVGAGDGQPAILIVASGGDGHATEMTLVNSGSDGIVSSVVGGNGGDGDLPGSGGAGIEVVLGVKDGVVVNIGEGVRVSGGAGGEAVDGAHGATGKAVIGEIGENLGEIVKIPVAVPEVASKPYTGAKQTATISGSPDYDVVENEGGVDVGTYSVTLALVDAQNFCWDDGGEGASRTLAWQITPLEMTGVTMADLVGVYDGVAHGVNVSVADGVEGVTIKYATAADGEFAAAPPMLTNAGSMTVWCEISAPGYVTQTNSATITIIPAENRWMVEPSMSDWTVGEEPAVPNMGEAKFGEAGVSYGASGTSLPDVPGEYMATFVVPETGNYLELTKVVPFKVWAVEEAKLQFAMGGMPAIVVSDGDCGWRVKLTNDVGVLKSPIEIPDNLGPVTIDLNGHDLVGGAGQPAVLIVPSDGGGEPTRVTVDTTGGGAAVHGGDSAPAIEIADGVRDGALVNVGEGVVVQGGGDGTPAIVGDVGTNDGTVVKATYDMSGARWDYVGEFEYDGKTKTVLVSGLPPGVAVASYTGNKAANPGKYTAHAVLAYDERNYNEPAIANLVWAIKSPYRLVVKPDSGKRGSASGSGEYAIGAKTTIKAKAKRGYVFAGWFKDKSCKNALNPDGYDNRNPTAKIVMPASDTTIYAKFVTKAEDKKALKFSSKTKKLAKSPAKATAGKAFSLKLGMSSASLPTFTAKGLPKGLSVDKTTGRITGKAKRPGSYTATITVTSAAGNRITQKVKIVVRVPSWAKGTFYGTARPDGKAVAYLKFTVGSTGKVSGKVSYKGKAYSFASAYKSCTSSKAAFTPKAKVGSSIFKPGTVSVKKHKIDGLSFVEAFAVDNGVFAAQKKPNLVKKGKPLAKLIGKTFTFTKKDANSGLTKSKDKLSVKLGNGDVATVSGMVKGKALTSLAWVTLVSDKTTADGITTYVLYVDIIDAKLKYERTLVVTATVGPDDTTAIATFAK